MTCRRGLVARRLRFLHVRDRDEADLEALVRLIELARERIERGLLGLDGVLRGQHAEVALRPRASIRSCSAAW